MESSTLIEAGNMSAAAPANARSYLFVPADRPERIAKAWASGADAVIVDLEDAIAPVAKDSARAALSAFLDPARPVILRINAAASCWHAEDLRLANLRGVGALMVPKAENVAELIDLAGSFDGRIPLLPLIETARGLCNAMELARVTGVQRLVFGPVDFQFDLGLGGGYEELAPFRAQLVLASRVAGVMAPVDGPTMSIDDEVSLRSDAVRARSSGFGAKLCIHPRQVSAVNECLGPSAAEVAWARRVLDAGKASQGGVFAFEGRMVDRPVLARAEFVLSQYRG